MNSIPATRNPDSAARVLIIIPAFNEARSLPALVSRVSTLYPTYDIAVINDGSTDGTIRVVRETRARLVTLPCNLGIGGAMQTGFRIARNEDYDIAVQVDGDGQHPVEQVHLLVKAVLQSGCDIAIGSRFLSGSGYQSTLSRRLGIRIFSLWLSAICHTRITDATSGFRALNRRATELLSGNYAEDYPEVEAIVVAHRAGLRMCEVPVEMTARTEGVSSIGGLRSIGYMVKVSLAILMCSLRRAESAQ
ncbi:MAG: glycosyltransferase family 2 protein [Candidatus Korobacteraceae bacterium]